MSIREAVRHRSCTGAAVAGTAVLAADLAKGAGWAINLAGAEWAIRRPAHRRPTATRPQRAGVVS